MMLKRTLMMAGILLLGILIGNTLNTRRILGAFAHPFEDQKGYILEHDADVAKTGPAPHNGPGRSTGYNFFEKATDFPIIFRKRVLHPGAAIGYHPMNEDEIYYVLSGSGVMQMNGKEFPVKPGDAILTRPGSSHGLKQTGKDDLVLMICYGKK